MKLTTQRSSLIVLCLTAWAAWMGTCRGAKAEGFTTTTVQGIVYLANGLPGSGTLQLSWPAFTTANNQAVAAGRTNVTIGQDGYMSVRLAPNLGATPAGLYYTAVYHLGDGTTSTEYWVVPAAAQASVSQVRAQVMPSAQAVQAVSKGYVDQSISELTQSLLTASGGSLTGPLFLNGDPTQPAQAATKRYVDHEFANALPSSGGAASGPLTSVQLGAAYQVDQFSGADFGAKLQACLGKLDAVYGGTCDARNFTAAQAISSPLIVSTANATVQLPCATIASSNPIRITAGTRNVTFHGCALRGASNASGSQGGTVLLYSGTGPMIQVGDPTYMVDTLGFHIDNIVVNTTISADAMAQGLGAYRTQEMDLEGLYLLGNSNQTGITLDGTGNYTGGTFQDIQISGFGTALNGIGHQATNTATTDWVNASTFVRLHINCPTSGGSPISGTYGINLVHGDGNTFTGGDVEGCGTALHLGPNAQNNTIVGLRNENSIKQVVADAGSSYNNWMTGGTMFTGQLTDNGTRNSFLDTFHRSFNGLNGDWYGSQSDATVTNHYRIGTGTGSERGLLNRYQTDYGYRWTTGLSDASAGEQFYQVQDELNNVYRLSIGQYNHGQGSTNNQTVVNAAGSGAVVLNGSANAGTGGVIFGSGGAMGSTVATVNSAGNAQFNGTLQVGGASTFTNSTTVKNQADAEIDSILWAGSTANQKESFIYKDYSGASQWYMVKDAANNWALNSAVGGLDSFKAYQSSNSGDTYVNASNGSGHIRLNYEPGAGTETDIYSGPSSTLVAAFLGSTAIKFPGLAAASGRYCLQIDNSGYISNTGTACATGGGMNGTVNAGNTGQVAYYNGNGTVLAGTTSVPVSSGGTGATTGTQALANLGAQAAMPGVSPDGASGMTVDGNVIAGGTAPPAGFAQGTVSAQAIYTPSGAVDARAAGAMGNGSANDTVAVKLACSTARASNPPKTVYLPYGNYLVDDLGSSCMGVSFYGQPSGMALSVFGYTATLMSMPGKDVLHTPDPNTYVGSAPNRSWSLENITINVNDSVDPNNRTAKDGVTNGTTAVTSAAMTFGAGDMGKYMTLVYGWPDNTRDVRKIVSVPDAHTVVLDSAPTLSKTGVALYIPLDSPTFPHRWPGRWVDDASMTAGSSVLTSNRASFTCGDQGQWVVVKGAGAGGADLVAKIPVQACPSGTQTVDLGAGKEAVNTVSAASAYVGINDLGPYELIGNCGMAWDNFDGNSANWKMTGSKSNSYPILRNVVINTNSSAGQNHSCGIFFQGAWIPYGIDATLVNLTRLDYGIVEASVEQNLHLAGIGQDFQTWRHSYITATNPLIVYNGGSSRIEDWQLNSQNGFDFISLKSAVESQAGGWFINIPEFENNVGTGSHITGLNHVLEGTTLGRNAFVDSINTKCDHCVLQGGTAPDVLEVSGYHNDIYLAGSLDNLVVNSNNASNRVLGSTINSGLSSLRVSMLSNTRTAVGVDKKAEFISRNPSTPFNNLDDLWIWPGDILCHSLNPAPPIVADATSESGYYLNLLNGCGEDYWYTVKSPAIGLGGHAVIGGGKPVFGAGKYQLVAELACPSVTSITPTVQIKALSNGAVVATPSLGTMACSTGYTIIKSAVIDLSSYGGGVNYVYPSWPSVTGGIHLAWEAWRPLPEDWDGSHQPALLTGNTNSTVPNSVIPAPGGGATANLGGVQAKTCSSGHVSAIGSDGVPVCTADSGGNTSLPPWLQFYGDGSEGPYIPGGTATLEGEHWFSSVNIAAGVTVRTTHTVPMIIRSTGTCTVAGTIGNSAATGGGNSGAGAFWGGSGGGGGGGTAIGAVGNPALYGSGGDKGSAGTAGGGAGGDGPAAASLPSFQKALLLSSGNVWPQNFLYGGAIGVGGAIGGGGGSAGGAGGKGGGLIVLVCPTINLTGTVDVGGQNGGDSTGNNIGAGGGGGGGILIMRSPALTNSGTINTAGGSGGSCGAFTGCGVGGKGGNGWSAVLAQ